MSASIRPVLVGTMDESVKSTWLLGWSCAYSLVLFICNPYPDKVSPHRMCGGYIIGCG